LRIIITSSFGDGNSPRGTGLYATLAPQTLVQIYRDGFITLHLDYAHRTNIDALFIAGALIGIDFDFPTHDIHLS
jgi:hypothetical protein